MAEVRMDVPKIPHCFLPSQADRVKIHDVALSTFFTNSLRRLMWLLFCRFLEFSYSGRHGQDLSVQVDRTRYRS